MRSQVCHLTSSWLAELGDGLWQGSHHTTEPQAEAAALVTQMVAELGQEAAEAFDRERWYAGVALTRQIVEAHYLMARFRDDPKQRERWLAASNNRIEKSFRPSQMREAGGFLPSEYKTHCSWGGHPNPSGQWLLANHSRLIGDMTVLVADLAQHLTETANLLFEVIETLPYADVWVGVLPKPPALIAEWREKDPMAARFKFPNNPGEFDAIQG
jgi:hypothetical protein